MMGLYKIKFEFEITLYRSKRKAVIMNCGNCKKEYTKTGDHVPRILTSCGHTLCEFCISTLVNG